MRHFFFTTLPIIPINTIYAVWERPLVKYFCHMCLILLCLAPQSNKNCQARSAELTAISLSWWGLNYLAIHRNDMLCSSSSTDRFKAVIFHQGCVCLCGWYCPENPVVSPDHDLKSWYFSLWLNQEHPFSQVLDFICSSVLLYWQLEVWLEKQLNAGCSSEMLGGLRICGEVCGTVQQLCCKQFPHRLQAGSKRQSHFRLQLRLVLQALFIYHKCSGKQLRMGCKWQN